MKIYRSLSSSSCCAITIAAAIPVRGNQSSFCSAAARHSSPSAHHASVVRAPRLPLLGYSWKSFGFGTTGSFSATGPARCFHNSVSSLTNRRGPNPQHPSEKGKVGRNRGSVQAVGKGPSSSSSSSSPTKGSSKTTSLKDVSKGFSKSVARKSLPSSSSSSSSSSQGEVKRGQKIVSALVDEELDESDAESGEYVDEEEEDSVYDTDVDFEIDDDDEEFEEGEDDDEDSDFIDDMLEEEGEGDGEIHLGDGGDGGGVNLGQTQWGEKALMIAKEVLDEFGSNFSLYAFKTSLKGCVFVRLDKLSDRYGSPTMVEIESFSSIYGKRLEEAGRNGDLPDNLAIEVSSPGAERVVEVPGQLERFKDLPMVVRYVEKIDATGGEVLKDSIFALESFEIESDKSTWKLANVRANREQAGKGRALTRKQKELRAELPLSSLRLVHLHMDI